MYIYEDLNNSKHLGGTNEYRRIDVDNVISNFEEAFLESYLTYDKELKNNCIKNGILDWDKIKENNFYSENIEKIVQNLNPMVIQFLSLQEETMENILIHIL